jgi:hypothetical protein
MKSSGLPYPADTGHACPRSRGGSNCCYRNLTGRRAARSVFLSAEDPERKWGSLGWCRTSRSNHWSQSRVRGEHLYVSASVPFIISSSMCARRTSSTTFRCAARGNRSTRAHPTQSTGTISVFRRRRVTDAPSAVRTVRLPGVQALTPITSETKFVSLANAVDTCPSWRFVHRCRYTQGTWVVGLQANARIPLRTPMQKCERPIRFCF